MTTEEILAGGQTQDTSEGPLDVFLVTPTLLTGGAEKFVMELALRFDPQHFRVTVLVSRGQAEPAHVQTLQDAGIEVARLSGRTRFHSILHAAAVLVRRRPDVIHTNIGALLHVSLGALLLPNSVVRLHTLHSMAGHAEPGRRLGISRQLLRTLHFTPVSISRAVSESFAAAFDIPTDEFPLVPNGVDTQRFAPPQERHTSGETRFVAVGSLLPVKQHQDLIVAFSQMDKRLQANSKLTIVGGGPLEEELQALIQARGMQDHITLLGNQKDIPGILQQHDVFVSASRTEGFPLSLLEGLAVGLPAAVTAVDGVMDIVRDQVEGVLVPPQDANAMTKAMEHFAGDKTLQMRLGENARQRALSFSWERCLASYAALYRGEPSTVER